MPKLSLEALVRGAIRRRARELGAAESGVDVRAVEPLVGDAMFTLARRALDAGTIERRYLTKTWPEASVIAGVCDLTDEDYETLLMESLGRAMLAVDTEGVLEPLQFLPRMIDLRQSTSGAFAMFTTEGRSIRTRNTDQALDSLSGNLTIMDGVYVPQVAVDPAETTLPEQLNDRALQALAGLIPPSKVEQTAEAGSGGGAAGG